jgi:hypothetical protein
MIKTFRGLMTDGVQDTIVLHTNDGSTGYRIVKFEVIGPDADENIESTIKIYKTSQTVFNNTIDFSDNTLLAAALLSQSISAQQYPSQQTVIFDQEIFNQDIYIYTSGHSYNAKINYYLELEQVSLDLSENTVATLKDIRNIEQPT